ncbi:MAG: hypothetical protein ACKVZ6_10565, partial [Kineosporiaceae bacterium]
LPTAREHLSLRIAGPGPLAVARRTPATGGHGPQRRPDACTVRVAEESTLLHGWRSAATALQLLELVAAPATLLPYSATLHAARALDAGSPGTAALCGLARALLVAPGRRVALAHQVRDRAAHQLAVGGLHPATIRALDAVRTLADASPDDPAVLAPLFLRLYRLPAGAEVRLLDAVPVVLVAGAVDLSLTGPDVDLTVGGLSATDVDVVGFTDAMRPTPQHEAAPSQPGSATPRHAEPAEHVVLEPALRTAVSA